MMFDHSRLELQKLLMQCGIGHEFVSMGNESLITRARNKLAAKFLETTYTHLLFIDSDIEFNPTDVLAMLSFEKDFIGGAYPLKGLDWKKIKKAVQLHPDISDEDLEKMGASWSAHPFKGASEVIPFAPLEVKELATGFLLLSRKVFEDLKDKVSDYDRADNEPEMPLVMRDFFTVGVVNRVYESEDYSFSRRWREQGGTVYLAPWVNLNHQGTYSFKGDFNLMAKLLGEVG